MQIGVDSFGAVISDPATGLTVSALQRMDNLLDEIVLADQVASMFSHGDTTVVRARGFGSACDPGCSSCADQEHSPNKCGNRPERRRPRPNLSGIRHSRSDLPWAC